MHQDTLCFCECRLYELKNAIFLRPLMLVQAFFALAAWEYHLVFLVQPVEIQVLHAYGLPVIENLLACTVDHVGNLVRNHEFQVL